MVDELLVVWVVLLRLREDFTNIVDRPLYLLHSAFFLAFYHQDDTDDLICGLDVEQHGLPFH